MKSDVKKVAIKVGSNVLTLANGLPNDNIIDHLSAQIAHLKNKGHQVILISSGAVAAGRGLIDLKKNTDTVSQRQVLAALGQSDIFMRYQNAFKQKNLKCAQVLVTKESFQTRNHYLNIKNCLENLLTHDIVPIINENDVVSITELMFTDNDELSGLVASMLNVDKLLLLSNVDGIYDQHPENENAQIIRNFFETEIDLEKAISVSRSSFGRGGMISKVQSAIKTAQFGIDVHIGNGEDLWIVNDLIDRNKGTYFKGQKKKTSPIKKWLSQTESFSKAIITINKGANEALKDKKANSLLFVGITAIEGFFKKGDVVEIQDQNQNKVGLGMVSIGKEKAVDLIGKQGHPPFIHYNFLYLY